MRLSFLPWLFASALIVGCGDDSQVVGGSGGGPAGGSGAGESGGGPIGGSGGGPVGGGGTGGGGQVDPNPILERDPQISHDCSETRTMSSDIGATNSRLEGLVEVDGSFFAATLYESLAISQVELDGSFGDPLELSTEQYVARASITTTDGTDVITVWNEGDDLKIARVSSALALVDGPATIDGASGNNVTPAALLATAAGFALLYGVNVGSTVELRFLPLDADGQAVGDPVAIADVGETYAASAGITPTGDGGFAVAFDSGSYLDSDVDFVILDADGSPRFAPRRISQPSGTNLTSHLGSEPRHNVVRVGDAYWVAFTEDTGNYDAQEGSAIVRVAVVDDAGNATIHALQAPVDQIENRSPSFVEFDDRIGLTWTEGHIIWICGGCITDYDLHFVLLDPDGLVPASQVVTELHQNNGIRYPIVVRDGGTLLTGSMLDFHAVTIPATGNISCSAAE